MKIFDFHTHTFPDRIAAKALGNLSHASHTVPFADGTEKGLIIKMKEGGVSGSLILPVATSAQQVEKINSSAAEVNRKYKDEGLISFGCMHPMYENFSDELKRIRDLGLKGIKIHPVYQGLDIDDPVFVRIIKEAADLGLTVITHAGLDIGYPGVVRCSPLQCRHVVEEVGRFSFVLAHMGGWRNWDEVPDVLSDTGVFLDTAFSNGRFYPLKDDGYWHDEDCYLLNEEEFMRIVKAFGAGRILFGTDSPWSDQKESIAFIEKLPLSDDEKKKILWQNAADLLGLD